MSWHVPASPSSPEDRPEYFPDDDAPPPDGTDVPWCPPGEESPPWETMLIWWLEASRLSHVAGGIRLPGTPLFAKLVLLPDDLLEEMETVGYTGGRPRVIGLHRAGLKTLPVRDTSPRWDDFPYHLCWGFVIQRFDRAACAEVGGKFTTLLLEPVS